MPDSNKSRKQLEKELAELRRKLAARVSLCDESDPSATVLEDTPENEQLAVLAKFPDENPHPVMRVSLNGTILYANPASKRILDAWGGRTGRRLPSLPDIDLPSILRIRNSLEFESQIGSRVYRFTSVPISESEGTFLFGQDITEQRRFEIALFSSEANYRAIFDAVEDAILLHDADSGRIIDTNLRASQLYGYTLDEIKQLGVADLTSGPSRYRRKGSLERIRRAAAGERLVFEKLGRHKSGRTFWVQVVLKRLIINDHPYVVALVQDISERKKTEEQIQLAARVFENTIEAIMVTDPDGVIQMVNPAFSTITGYSAEEALGRKPSLFKSGRQGPEFYEQMWDELLKNGFWRGELWNRRKSGQIFSEWLTITAIRDANNQIRNFVAVFHDITEIKQTQEQIQHMAYHDALTGLPNRLMLNDRLAISIARAQRNGNLVAILFMDLDRFKNINDTLGHTVGDLLLREVARRLSASVRAGDTVSRQGGDEFIVILPDLSGTHQAVSTAERIIAAVARPYHLRGHELFISCSIGVTFFPQDAPDADTLIKNADMAMYRAKDTGRNTYQLYTEALNTEILQRVSLERELRKALDKNRFIIHYQPKVQPDTGKIVGAEALIRWRRRGKTLVPPANFIPLAEETGLIIPIGEFVIEEACRQAVDWHRHGYTDLTVSVNLSAHQFNQEDLLDMIGQALAKSGLDPKFLELEIQESAMVTSTLEKVTRSLLQLHQLGVNISLDEFGTGYSSLDSLKKYHVDTLKISSSLLQNIPDNAGNVAIARAVASLARDLGLGVVALGVETEGQLAFLKDLDCCLIQGFYYSPPVDAESFLNLLQSGFPT